MERIKALAKRLFCIHWALALSLAVLAAGSLVWVFALGNETSPLAVACYVLSFYALIVVCTTLVPVLVRWGKEKKLEQDRMDETQRAKGFRTSLLQSLCIKLAYAAFNLVSGLVTRSVWLVSMGLYYLVMAVIRVVLAKYERRLGRLTEPKERWLVGWKGFQACGVLLMLLHLTATGVVVQMIRDGQTQGDYGEIMVIASAAYTFYRMIAAIISVVQHQKNPSPIWGASRNLRLTEAMMSLFFLQSSMMTVFGGDADFQYLMNSLTGSAVCVLAVLGAVGMIVHGEKRKRQCGEMEHGT